MAVTIEHAQTDQHEIADRANGRTTAPVRAERVRARIEDLEMIERTHQALDVLQPKWAVDVLFLIASGIRRHARIVDNRAGLSKKVLTATLRTLERSGIVERRVFSEMPVRIEYSLTQLGWDLTAVLMALHDWVVEHEDELSTSRSNDCPSQLPLAG
jgi:DNA-binding HxlR family transcriptional regulator